MASGTLTCYLRSQERGRKSPSVCLNPFHVVLIYTIKSFPYLSLAIRQDSRILSANVNLLHVRHRIRPTTCALRQHVLERQISVHHRSALHRVAINYGVSHTKSGHSGPETDIGSRPINSLLGVSRGEYSLHLHLHLYLLLRQDRWKAGCRRNRSQWRS